MKASNIKKGMSVKFIPNNKTYNVTSDVQRDNTVTIHDAIDNRTQWVNIKDIQVAKSAESYELKTLFSLAKKYNYKLSKVQ